MGEWEERGREEIFRKTEKNRKQKEAQVTKRHFESDCMCLVGGVEGEWGLRCRVGWDDVGWDGGTEGGGGEGVFLQG